MTAKNYRFAVTPDDNAAHVVANHTRRLLRRFVHERDSGCRTHSFTTEEAALIVSAMTANARALLGDGRDVASALALARGGDRAVNRAVGLGDGAGSCTDDIADAPARSRK